MKPNTVNLVRRNFCESTVFLSLFCIHNETLVNKSSKSQLLNSHKLHKQMPIKCFFANWSLLPLISSSFHNPRELFESLTLICLSQWCCCLKAKWVMLAPNFVFPKTFATIFFSHLFYSPLIKSLIFDVILT